MCYPTAILLLSYCYPTVRPRRDHETVTEGVLSGYLSGTKKGAPDGVPLVVSAFCCSLWVLQSAANYKRISYEL